MRIQHVRWSPDTCGCTVTYEYDADLPLDRQVFKYNSTETLCSAHGAHQGEALYNVLMDENRPKNQAIAIAEAFGIPVENISARYDETRRLVLSVRQTDPTVLPELRRRLGAVISRPLTVQSG